MYRLELPGTKCNASLILLSSKIKGFFFVSRSTKRCRYEKCLFCIRYFSQTKSSPAKKKLDSNVPQVKRSPHAKIELFLSTFKNGRKIKGRHFLARGLSIFHNQKKHQDKLINSSRGQKRKKGSCNHSKFIQ